MPGVIPAATTAARQARFIEVFAAGSGDAKAGCITDAAAAAGIGRRTHYFWKATDPAYAERFRLAEDEAVEAIERKFRELAVEGVLRYKFDKDGNPLMHPITGEPYVEREYNVTAGIFLLKGLRPEKYKERHEHTGKGGGPIDVTHRPDLSDLTDDELALLERIHDRRRLAAAPQDERDSEIESRQGVVM